MESLPRLLLCLAITQQMTGRRLDCKDNKMCTYHCMAMGHILIVKITTVNRTKLPVGTPIIIPTCIESAAGK